MLTEGQRLLIAAGSGASIAGTTGLSKGAISEFRAGKKTPGAAARGKLVALGIPIGAWDVSPRPPRPTAAIEEPADEGSMLEAFEGAEAADGELDLRTIAAIRAELEAHVRRIRRTLVPTPGTPELSDAETTKRMSAHTQALRTLAQVRQDEDLLETRIIFEQAGFKRVFDAVFRVLKPHPELAREIAAVLRAEEQT